MNYHAIARWLGAVCLLLTIPTTAWARMSTLQWGVYRSGAPTEVLWSSVDSKIAVPIASITKLMTAYLVLEHAQQTSYQMLDQPVSILSADTQHASTTVLRVGNRTTVRDLLYLMVVSSDNVAARALGRHLAGSREAFVSQMNAAAARLRMTQTTYADPAGLLAGNTSTPLDLVKLTDHLIAYQPDFPELFSSQQYTAHITYRRRIRAVTVFNTNRLLNSQVEVSKTGFTSSAGYCLIERVESSSGHDYVVVVLGAPTRESRAVAIHMLLQWIEPSVTLNKE